MPPPPTNNQPYSSSSSTSTALQTPSTQSKAKAPPPAPTDPPPRDSLQPRPGPAPPPPPDGNFNPVPDNERQPKYLRDDDARFKKDNRRGTIWCDSCHYPVYYKSQSYKYDGDWQFPKTGTDKIYYKQLWEAGQDCTWFCIKCLARSCGRNERDPATLEALREERGLLERKKRRMNRMTNSKRERLA